jgi:hypothetical protein
MKAPKNKHRGSSLDDFLKEEGIYDEVCATATKRVLAEALRHAMEKKKLNVSTLASRMRTSRPVIQRLLDKENCSVTLQTLDKAARALGKRWSFKLVEA